MKLVIEYTATDGYTWSNDITQCINYESKEKFLFDLELAIEEQIAKNKKEDKFWSSGNVTIGNLELYVEHFVCSERNDESFYEPAVYELDEWFNYKTK